MNNTLERKPFLTGDMEPKTLKGWMENIQNYVFASAIIWGGSNLAQAQRGNVIVPYILITLGCAAFVLSLMQSVFMVAELVSTIRTPESRMKRQVVTLLAFVAAALVPVAFLIVGGSLLAGGVK